MGNVDYVSKDQRSKYRVHLGIALTCFMLSIQACVTKQREEVLPKGCYKGIVVRDKSNACDFVVQLKNGDFGYKWDDLENCVHVKNLPDEGKKIGAKIYFTSYKKETSPFCTSNKLELPGSISIENYSPTKCQ